LDHRPETAVTTSRKLIALDADDLAVISMHVQDARVRPAEIIWRPNDKRLVIAINRLDWDAALQTTASPRRLIAALRFERVLACQSRHIDLEAMQAPLQMLGIEFYPAEPPGGSAVLMFAGGGALRLDLECLECELADLAIDGRGTSDFDEDAGSSTLEA
jgi:hypothetical protein